MTVLASRLEISLKIWFRHCNVPAESLSLRTDGLELRPLAGIGGTAGVEKAFLLRMKW